MDDEQFELDGLVFGRDQLWRVAEWDRGERALQTQDTPWPTRDGRAPGRDTEPGPEWSFLLRPRAGAGAALLAAIGQLRSAWEGPRSTPLATSTLRYTLEGRTRRVYGRPRRFAEVSTPHSRAAGLSDVDATFQLTDPLYYSDAEGRVDLNIVPAESALLRFPTAPPFRWASPGDETVRGAVVGGDAPTPLTVRFFGPVSRPWVRVGGVLIQVTGDLAYDRTLIVDARAKTIRYENGTPAPGMISPATRLADLRVAPGVHEVTYGGVDITGTSRVEVAWRDAWRSL